MNHPAASPRQRRLDAIRNRVTEASKDWGFSGEADGMRLLAGEDGTELIAIVPVAANFVDRELVLNAPLDLIWLLDLYQVLASSYRAALDELERLRPSDQKAEKPKDFAAECAMKCAVPAFKLFLHECHGLEKPLTDDRVVTRVRSILNIKSRADLNTDPAAAARWRDLVNAFEAWRRR